MTKVVASRTASRVKRHERLRLRLSGTEARPPLGLPQPEPHLRPGHRRHQRHHRGGRGLARYRPSRRHRKKTEDAKRVGQLVAERAKAASIDKVVFDRAGFKYHGRVRSLAEAAREAGLDF